MKKPIIVITHPDSNLNTNGSLLGQRKIPGLSLSRNVEALNIPNEFNLEGKDGTFVQLRQDEQKLRSFTEHNFEVKKEQNKFLLLKQEGIEGQKDVHERVEGAKSLQKNQKKKKNKNKTDFEIKNVLQQISSSIQSCVKDKYIYELTEQYEKELKNSGDDRHYALYKKNQERMQFLLDNPTQFNFGCLLKMKGEINIGLKLIFRSRILKKYIQCSKIRTLKQKSICLEAVDYLYRCFREQQICSLHTWAHKRDQKLLGKLDRLKKQKIEKQEKRTKCMKNLIQ